MMFMPHLNNARDAQVISILEAMRYDNKVLEEIDAKKLTQKSKNKKGVLMGICPDGHQSFHKLNRIKEFCEMGKIDGHVHIMECPGGMAAILPDSPMNNEELMNHTVIPAKINIAVFAGQYDLCTLSIHYPCVWANSKGVGTIELMDGLLQACDFLKKRFQNICFVPLVQIAWQDGRKRYYFLNEKEFRSFKINNLALYA
jgi:hypothetical protein